MNYKHLLTQYELIKKMATPIQYLDATDFQEYQARAVDIVIADTFVPWGITESGLLNVVAGAARADGLDIVITDVNGNLIPREVARFDKATGEMQIWYRDPAQSPITGGTFVYLQWGGTYTVNNDFDTWQNNYGGAVDHGIVYHKEENAGNAINAAINGVYNGNVVGPAYNAAGEIHDGYDYDGVNDEVNAGDYLPWNTATNFTLQMWVSQDVPNQYDILYEKYLNDLNRVQLLTFNDGNTYIPISNGINGFARLATPFDGTLRQYTQVYNGAGVGDANRLQFYVNGVNQMLAFFGAGMPAATANLAGIDLTVSTNRINQAWDGIIDEVRIHNGSLTQNQVTGQYNNQDGAMLNTSITLGDGGSFAEPPDDGEYRKVLRQYKIFWRYFFLPILFIKEKT